MGLFVLGFYAGTVIQISKEQAEIIKRELREKNQNLDGLGIFVNNAIPGLEMFIPGAGIGIGTYASFSTGQVLNAFSVDNPALKRISPLSLLISPFALLEIFAYAIGMSRSGMLVYYLIRKRKTLKQSWKKIHYSNSNRNWNSYCNPFYRIRSRVAGSGSADCELSQIAEITSLFLRYG